MAQLTGSYDMMRRQLRPMGARLRLGDTLYVASRTLWLATLAALLVALLGRLLPIPNLAAWASLPLSLWLVGVAAYLLLRPLPLRRVAQRVDSALALRERLATALELHERSADDELSALQREDAAAAAQMLRPAQLPLRDDRRLAL